MKFSRILNIFLLLFVVFAPLAVFAQPGFGGDTNDVPLDGGVSFLVVAGVGYGAKKLKERRAKQNLLNTAENK